MVTVFLRGGLGNQMFQYATGLALAKRNKTELLLDAVHIQDRFPRKNFTYRTFDLDIFTLVPRFTWLSHTAKVLPLPGVWLGIDLMRMSIADALHIEKTVYEMKEIFDPAFLEARGNLFLFGGWQNEKYFIDIRDEVKSAFRFRHPLNERAARVAEEIRVVNSVSVHVRRGDFATAKAVIRLMGPIDTLYYDRASEYVAKQIKNPKFFIFSDDIAWCEQNIKLKFPTVYLGADTAGPKGSHHLELMSLCKHNITTNSTFSWWGGWLNENPQKIITAPKQWYGDPEHKTDILPDAWIKL